MLRLWYGWISLNGLLRALAGIRARYPAGMHDGAWNKWTLRQSEWYRGLYFRYLPSQADSLRRFFCFSGFESKVSESNQLLIFLYLLKPDFLI